MTLPTQKPTLYQYSVCPFCWKVKTLLAYKKIPYQSVEVHPLNKKEIAFSKDYRKVPIFIDATGKQLNDSTPIMRHIDQQYADLPVFEKDTPAREEEDRWLIWADATLVRALPPLIYRNLKDSMLAFDYITRVGKFSWFQQRIIKYSGAAVMTMVAKKSAKSQNISDPEKHVAACLAQWAQALQDRPFLGNTKPNGADLAVFGILKSIETFPAFRYVREQPKVYEWYQRVDQQALQRA